MSFITDIALSAIIDEPPNPIRDRIEFCRGDLSSRPITQSFTATGDPMARPYDIALLSGSLICVSQYPICEGLW